MLDMCTKFHKDMLRGFVVKLRKRNVTDRRTDGNHFYIPRQLRWLAGDNDECIIPMLAQAHLDLVKDLVMSPCLVKGNMYPSIVFVTLKFT